MVRFVPLRMFVEPTAMMVHSHAQQQLRFLTTSYSRGQIFRTLREDVNVFSPRTPYPVSLFMWSKLSGGSSWHLRISTQVTFCNINLSLPGILPHMVGRVSRLEHKEHRHPSLRCFDCVYGVRAVRCQRSWNQTSNTLNLAGVKREANEV